MTSPRGVWSASILGLSSALVAGGRAEAQFASFIGIPGRSSAAVFGPGDEGSIAYGLSPFDYGSYAAGGFGGSGRIGAFPLPGYGRSICRRPLTTTSFEPLYHGITSLLGWSGRVHRVRRRF
jgi:hypothetical protein